MAKVKPKALPPRIKALLIAKSATIFIKKSAKKRKKLHEISV